jgi:hypothetical protein
MFHTPRSGGWGPQSHITLSFHLLTHPPNQHRTASCFTSTDLEAWILNLPSQLSHSQLIHSPTQHTLNPSIHSTTGQRWTASCFTNSGPETWSLRSRHHTLKQSTHPGRSRTVMLRLLFGQFWLIDWLINWFTNSFIDYWLVDWFVFGASRRRKFCSTCSLQRRTRICSLGAFNLSFTNNYTTARIYSRWLYSINHLPIPNHATAFYRCLYLNW